MGVFLIFFEFPSTFCFLVSKFQIIVKTKKIKKISLLMDFLHCLFLPILPMLKIQGKLDTKETLLHSFSIDFFPSLSKYLVLWGFKIFHKKNCSINELVNLIRRKRLTSCSLQRGRIGRNRLTQETEACEEGNFPDNEVGEG